MGTIFKIRMRISKINRTQKRKKRRAKYKEKLMKNYHVKRRTHINKINNYAGN